MGAIDWASENHRRAIGGRSVGREIRRAKKDAQRIRRATSRGGHALEEEAKANKRLRRSIRFNEVIKIYSDTLASALLLLMSPPAYVDRPSSEQPGYADFPRCRPSRRRRRRGRQAKLERDSAVRYSILNSSNRRSFCLGLRRALNQLGRTTTLSCQQTQQAPRLQLDEFGAAALHVEIRSARLTLSI